MKRYNIKIKFYNTIILEFDIQAFSEDYAKAYADVIIKGLRYRQDKIEAIIKEI